MIIGVPKEIKNNEYRVALMPSGVNELTRTGHQVLIQKDAGAGSMIPDDVYKKYGAKIADTADEVYKASDLILKVKEPLACEYELLKEDQTIFTFLHLAANKELAKVLMEKNIFAISYDTVEDDDGTLPILRPMSEIAGRMSVVTGANLLLKHNKGMGLFIGGIPGVAPAKVVIAGGGTVGVNAAKMAAGLGADVTVLDINHKKLAMIDDLFNGRVKTVLSDSLSMEKEALMADLFIGAVLVPGRKAPVVLSEQVVEQMKPGSVIVDVAIDQGGCVQTIDRATSHDDPVYIKHGVLHYAVPNIPGIVPATSTPGLTGVTFPYVRRIVMNGPEKACADDRSLADGVNVQNGRIVNHDVSISLGSID